MVNKVALFSLARSQYEVLGPEDTLELANMMMAVLAGITPHEGKALPESIARVKAAAVAGRAALMQVIQARVVIEEAPRVRVVEREG